jgi:hypothetical protein
MRVKWFLLLGKLHIPVKQADRVVALEVVRSRLSFSARSTHD